MAHNHNTNIYPLLNIKQDQTDTRYAQAITLENEARKWRGANPLSLSSISSSSGPETGLSTDDAMKEDKEEDGDSASTLTRVKSMTNSFTNMAAPVTMLAKLARKRQKAKEEKRAEAQQKVKIDEEVTNKVALKVAEALALVQPDQMECGTQTVEMITQTQAQAQTGGDNVSLSLGLDLVRV